LDKPGPTARVVPADDCKYIRWDQLQELSWGWRRVR